MTDSVDIKPTRLERIISAFSPRLAMQRMAQRVEFQSAAGGYSGAHRSKRDALRGWNVSRGDADADLLPDLEALRENSRDLARNNPIGAGAKNAKLNHIVGSGLKLNAALNREFLGIADLEADEWEDDVERRWCDWWDKQHSDLERTIAGPEHQKLAFSSVLDNGDHLIFLARKRRPGQLNELCLQHIETDRLINENNATDTKFLSGGVEKDRSGAPVAYHVMNGHPGQRYFKDMTWTKLPAFGRRTGRPLTLHIYDKLRPGQTRGVPHLSPVIEIIKQIGRYTEAEIDAAVKTAMFAMVLKTKTADGLAGLNLDSWRGTRREYYKENPVDLKGGSALAVGLFPDDEMTPFDPNRPNSAAEPFLATMFQLIGMALEIPYEVLINHFSSSWSASQAALMQMWRTVQSRRGWLASRMMNPIYDAWLANEVLAERISAPGFFSDPIIRSAYAGAIWVGDPKGHINEQQQVGAAIDRIEADLSTKKYETASIMGQDWDKVRRQRDREERLRPSTPRSNVRNEDPNQENDDLDERDERDSDVRRANER